VTVGTAIVMVYVEPETIREVSLPGIYTICTIPDLLSEEAVGIKRTPSLTVRADV
jgi:hypothetical protein